MKIKKYKFVFEKTHSNPPVFIFANKRTEETKNGYLRRVVPIDYIHRGNILPTLADGYSETAISIMILDKLTRDLAQRIKEYHARTQIHASAIPREDAHIEVMKQNVEIWEEKVRVLKEKPEYIFEIVQQ